MHISEPKHEGQWDAHVGEKKKRQKEARFNIPPALLWWGGGPIRNIMSFLSLTQLALRCTADLPQCCTRHISGR